MDINLIIDDLNNNKENDRLEFVDNLLIIDNYQLKINDGFVGVFNRKNQELNTYDVYLYIKSIEKIACPLCLRSFDDVQEAKKYYNSLKKSIEKNDIKKIIMLCKTSG